MESEACGYKGLHERYGLRDEDIKGKTILDCCLAFDCKIANTCFKKQEGHPVTYKSDPTYS